MSQPNNKNQAADLLSAFVEESLTESGAVAGDHFGFMPSLLEHLPALFSVTDSRGQVLVASHHHTCLLGAPEDMAGITHRDHLFPGTVQRRVAVAPVTSAEDGKKKFWELKLCHKNGAEHVYRMIKMRLDTDDGPLECLTGIDITDTKQTEDSLRSQQEHMDYVAYHDALTGLANRSLFYERVNTCIALAKRNNSSFAILLIDLDRFKKINDSLGHDAGDAYLCYIARRLEQVVRPTDTTARLGGDEFVVVLENVHDRANVEKVAANILATISKSVTVQGHDISSSASIGISVFPEDGTAVDKLLKHADQAMYQAKAAGKNRAAFFNRAMDDTARMYLLLENDLRRAIDKDELCVHYQPQVDLRTGKIIGLEALARWDHKTRGPISPAHFIPLAEDTGLIEPLGEWVLREACQRFQYWLSEGINFSKIAVNLSAKQFTERSFEDVVSEVLKKTGLPPSFLELEITESSAMTHANETIETLTTLSNMGLSLAIDDFGTGYSSLAYLKRFPFSKLKIDRSFIDEVDTDAESSDAAIAQTIIDLARNMKVQVLAEGVERLSQSAWLLERGCDQVQGFFYSRPLSEEQLLELVSDGKAIWDRDGVRLKI